MTGQVRARARPEVLVAGASGFAGRRLVPALLEQGYPVRAITRNPAAYRGPGRAIGADINDVGATADAMSGCQTAYYLVHSLDRADFETHDATLARTFGTAAAAAGVSRIIYLGGLGEDSDDLSPHLRSRRAVETLLGEDGVPVTTLRAGIIIGHGSTSWQLIRTLVERVPVIMLPSWARTRTQPIAATDAVRYLVGVLAIDDRESHSFDIGGADVLTYLQMLKRLSVIQGRPPLAATLPIPRSDLLSAAAAALVLPLITGVNRRTLQSLAESMRNEVLVRDNRISQLVPFTPMGYDEAVLAALGERAAEHRNESSVRVP